MTTWYEYLQQSQGFRIFTIIIALFCSAIVFCTITEKRRKSSGSYIDKLNISTIRKAKLVWIGMLSGFFISYVYAFAQMAMHVGHLTSSQEFGALFFGLFGALGGALFGAIRGRRTVATVGELNYPGLSRVSMTKISSTSTFIHKKVLPCFWFGFLTFFVFVLLKDRIYEKAPFALIIPCIAAIFGFIIMKKLVWDLADEVYDCGDFLLVKKKDTEEKVELSNIINVSASLYTNPKRITLRLERPGTLGSEITFSPEVPFFSSINPFARSQIADDLIVRMSKMNAEQKHDIKDESKNGGRSRFSSVAGILLSAMLWGVIGGVVGFVGGFFGPIVFSSSPQGPLLSIITGPLGVVIGCLFGAVAAFRQR